MGNTGCHYPAIQVILIMSSKLSSITVFFFQFAKLSDLSNGLNKLVDLTKTPTPVSFFFLFKAGPFSYQPSA